jgi:hypothetical protein
LPHCFIDGKPATYGEVLQSGMDSLANACVSFFELNDENGQALAYMCDNAIKWGEAMCKGKEPLLYAIGEEPILGFKYNDVHPYKINKKDEEKNGTF